MIYWAIVGYCREEVGVYYSLDTLPPSILGREARVYFLPCRNMETARRVEEAIRNGWEPPPPGPDNSTRRATLNLR